MPADTARPVPRQQALRVDSLEVQRVAEGSALGAAGDLLLTFKGSGFALTSKAPRLLLPGGAALESTEINREGTELYVLVPRGQTARIGAMRFDSVVVANPGRGRTSSRPAPRSGCQRRAWRAPTRVRRRCGWSIATERSVGSP
jgi:hypothetical protein